MLKSFKKRALIAGIMAACLGFGAQGIVAPDTAEAKVNFDGYFDFEPHRGGRDARPENTLYSYAYAMEMGATSIECDMQLTADGRIVMSHNPILNKEITRDANGNWLTDKDNYDIRKMTVEQLKKFNIAAIDPSTPYYAIHGTTQVNPASAQLATLEELLQLINDYGDKDVFLNIETKSYPDPVSGQAYTNNADPEKFVKVFNDIVTKYGFEDRVVLQSFDWRTLVAMKKLNPNISLSALWCEQPSWGRDSQSLRPNEKETTPWLAGLDIKDYDLDPVKAAAAIGVDVVSPYYGEVTVDMINEAHALGMKIVPWTVNNPKEISAMVDMGVDGLISDKPWILRSVLEKKGVKLHEPVVKADSPYHLTPNHIVTDDDVKVAGGMDAAY